MEGTDPKEKLNSTYWNALQKNWMVWPAVQAINFKLVPLEHRVLVVNIVSLGECFPMYGLALDQSQTRLDEVLILFIQDGIAILVT